MQPTSRKSFRRLLLTILGYALFGNVLATVLTISSAIFIQYTVGKALITVLALLIYYLIILTPAYKDGLHEHKLMKLKHLESTEPLSALSRKWVKLGLVAGAVYSVPSVVLLLNAAGVIGGSFLVPFRFICGAVYPLSLFLAPDGLGSMPVFAPAIFILLYLLSPVMTYVGFKIGLRGEFSFDKIMYK